MRAPVSGAARRTPPTAPESGAGAQSWPERATRPSWSSASTTATPLAKLTAAPAVEKLHERVPDSGLPAASATPAASAAV